MRTPPIPVPLASQCTSKGLSKLGSTSKGACVRQCLRVWKAFSWEGPQTKGAFFLLRACKGEAMVILDETSVETGEAKETTHLREGGRLWPSLDGSNLS